MAATQLSELLLDESIRHQIALAKYTNGSVARIIAVLNRSDARLAESLMTAISQLDSTSFSVQRLQSLLGSVRAINSEAYNLVSRALTDELKNFAEYETSYLSQMLDSYTPVAVHVAAIDAGTVYAAALSRPFQGVLLQDVLSDLSEARARAIRRSIAQGFVEGKTMQQMLNEVRGTRAKGYTDGLLEGSRREVAAVVRTATSHLAGIANDNMVSANEDVIGKVVWVATLDTRTTSQCRIRDGKAYTPIEHKPIGHKIPWGAGPGRVHWNCRSSQTFVTKSFKELGLDIPEATLKNGKRATIDGQIPQETTYGQWLKKQPLDRQVEVLGKTRAALLRKGGLKLEDMYTQRGEYLTLDELRERDAAAFKKAGLQ